MSRQRSSKQWTPQLSVHVSIIHKNMYTHGSCCSNSNISFVLRTRTYNSYTPHIWKGQVRLESADPQPYLLQIIASSHVQQS